MLIDLKQIVQKYNLNIRGVIQVGAHWAEEHDIYVQLGIKNIYYIEPCVESFEKMVYKIVPDANLKRPYNEFATISFQSGTKEKLFDYHFNNIACADIEGEFEMYASPMNEGQSNSLLEPNLHLYQHPEIQFTQKETVKVKRLDDLGIVKEKYNLLVMDVQGAEGLVLKGATEILKHIDIIYTEVNRDYTYENNMLIDEMDEYLAYFGFARIETFWPSSNWSWGDSVYLKVNKRFEEK